MFIATVNFLIVDSVQGVQMHVFMGRSVGDKNDISIPKWSDLAGVFGSEQVYEGRSLIYHSSKLFYKLFGLRVWR